MKARVALLFFMLPGVVHAAPVDDRRSFRAEAALTSDYVFRGYSWSDSNPAVQAGARFSHRLGFFGGLWGSSVRFAFDAGLDDRRGAEIRAYAGYARSIGPRWSGNALIVRYEFPGAESSVDTSFSEVQLSVRYQDLISATIAHTPDFLDSGSKTTFVEFTGSYPVAYGIDLSAGIGAADSEFDPASYTYGHVGASRTFGPVTVDLGYYETDGRPIRRWGEVVDGILVLGVSIRSPVR